VVKFTLEEKKSKNFPIIVFVKTTIKVFGGKNTESKDS
jgi:hypothetical protein